MELQDGADHDFGITGIFIVLSIGVLVAHALDAFASTGRDDRLVSSGLKGSPSSRDGTFQRTV
jgi:hypothetical protein